MQILMRLSFSVVAFSSLLVVSGGRVLTCYSLVSYSTLAQFTQMLQKREEIGV